MTSSHPASVVEPAAEAAQPVIASLKPVTLDLDPHHLADLRKSGLSDETIIANQFRTERDLLKLAKDLNWKKYSPGMGTGLVIPFFASDGSLISFLRIKPTNPRKPKGAKKPAKYESPVGHPNLPYFPVGISEAISDPTKSLSFTEGEKKAAKATQEGFPTIGVTGVFNWKQPGSHADSLIPDLAAIKWASRPVTICFDSDRVTNPNVLDAEWRLASVLRAQGAIVKIIVLPSLPDGSKCGLDDFLVTYGREAFQRLIDTAIDPVQPSKTNAIGRLEQLLLEGPEPSTGQRKY